MIWSGLHPLFGPLEGVGLKISTFLGPNGTRFPCGHLRAEKSLNFQGPPLPMALEMDVAHIKIISSHPI